MPSAMGAAETSTIHVACAYFGPAHGKTWELAPGERIPPVLGLRDSTGGLTQYRLLIRGAGGHAKDQDGNLIYVPLADY